MNKKQEVDSLCLTPCVAVTTAEPMMLSVTRYIAISTASITLPQPACFNTSNILLQLILPGPATTFGGNVGQRALQKQFSLWEFTKPSSVRARTSLTRTSLRHHLGALLQSPHHSTVLSAQRHTGSPLPYAWKCYRSYGSVDPATGAAGAAFVSGQTTKQWRLTDGASCLQAELVAIRGALHHALESHSPHVIIHTDSKFSIQALKDTQPQDNIHLLTSTLLLAQRLAARGCKITLNWVPSHVGLNGNETADRAAKSAAALPSPTTAVLPSLSQTLLKIKSASHALSRQQHEATVALSSPSASWYAAATAYHPLPQDPSIPPLVRDRLHRLRLGFPCFEEIRQGAVDTTCDHCQVTSPFALQHYLLKCEATSHLRERLPPHPQPGHPGAPAAAAAVIRSVPLATLTSTVREYPPPKLTPQCASFTTCTWLRTRAGFPLASLPGVACRVTQHYLTRVASSSLLLSRGITLGQCLLSSLSLGYSPQYPPFPFLDQVSSQIARFFYA
ncbi:hypothetical protein GWK47_050197 [Chionoecetes opilio]|uniref:ribonuclease H n=1 Tax=Chionoecetes opilio TaxID=41210 RepID=A0A8J5CTU0_CHIOP|nr:hypothetical protein GWK47_050197 [Chionoecetes opilio]